ncbi:MAG: hypothetical protein OEW12_00900 [Deltaproteobacteria bacterium]|nr:hypothetical protein [Deltaproteobacteria bacterium]
MAEHKDNISTAKASLELVVMENESLLSHFSNLLKELEDMEALPPEEKRKKFRELESQGAFKFQGVDIRRFQVSTNKPLPSKEFLRRTQRRLQNTTSLINDFQSRGEFAEGEQLKIEIEMITSALVDDTNPAEVRAFKTKVEDIRDSELFKTYQITKKKFILQDPDVRTDVEMVSVKESVEDSQQAIQDRGSDLKEIQDKMDAGELSADEVMTELANLSKSSEGSS